MTWDLEERAWWVFALPESTSYVPANSESEARRRLAATSYKGAPVHLWPLVATRVTSRQALVASLMKSPSPTSSGSSSTETEEPTSATRP